MQQEGAMKKQSNNELTYCRIERGSARSCRPRKGWQSGVAGMRNEDKGKASRAVRKSRKV